MKVWDVTINGVYATQVEAPTKTAAISKAKGYFGHYKKGKVAVKMVRRNPAKPPKAPSKLQRLINSTKRAKAKRIAKALSAYLKQRNPGTKYAGAKVVKNPGGSITIIPIKANPGGLKRILSEYGHQRRGGSGRVDAIKRAVSSTRRNPKRGRR